jgi:GMP synthase (glutamine-hydrolysing)
MAKVLLVQHVTRESPGLVLDVLKERGIAHDLADLEKGARFPDPLGYAAVFVFGGPMSANDTAPAMRDGLARVREILSARIPFLGVCLGMQALVKAAGGDVVRNRMKEIGALDPDGKPYSVEVTVPGTGDPLMQGLPPSFPIFQLHGETVALGHGMQSLGAGKWCEHQVVRVGESAYGVQGHLEVTGEMLDLWLAQDPDFGGFDKAAIREAYAHLRPSYESSGRKLIGNFLDIAGLE